MTMKRLELMQLHWDLCGEARAIMTDKNQDYGGPGVNADPFRNFRTHGLYGIIVRMSDKLARLQSYCEAGKLYVKSEGVRDSVHDLINYAVLFEGMVIDDANRIGSTGRSGEGEGGPRPPARDAGASASDIGRGVRGSGEAGIGTGARAALERFASQIPFDVEVRTGAGDRRRRAMDKQSGRGKGKR